MVCFPQPRFILSFNHSDTVRPQSVTVRFRSRTTAVSACYVKLSTKIRSNVLKAGYRMQDLFCDNNLWFRDFVITRNQVASHLVVIFWYVHVIYNFEYSSRDLFTVMLLLVAPYFNFSTYGSENLSRTLFKANWILLRHETLDRKHWSACIGLQAMNSKQWTASIGLQAMNCKHWTASIGLQAMDCKIRLQALDFKK